MRSVLNIVLWIVQIALAGFFLLAAWMKLFAFGAMSAKLPGIAGLHNRFVVIAICEIAGAIGLILPRPIGILPVLTRWAAVGLATVVFLAGLFHAHRGEYGELPLVAVLFVLSVFVIWGRGFGASRTA